MQLSRQWWKHPDLDILGISVGRVGAEMGEGRRTRERYIVESGRIEVKECYDKRTRDILTDVWSMGNVM